MAITQITILPLEYGDFRISYHKTAAGDCVSAAYGELDQGVPVVRIHSSCLFGESFHGLDCDCAAQLHSTFKLIRENGSGVIVYTYAEGRGLGLEKKIAALELQRTRHVDTVEAFKLLGFEPDLRTYDAEIAVLKELHVARMVKVAGQNPRKLAAVREGGFEIVEQLHPEIRLTEHNIPELLTKKNLLGYNIQRDLRLPDFPSGQPRVQ